jgi:perosamine synthetase
MIPLSVPSLKGNELKYVTKCIKTEWISSSGKFVKTFEDKVSSYLGAKHAIACINGTSALQVSLRILGVLPNDEVIVPTITFVAPVNAIIYNNAKPIFMDCDEFFNIDVNKTIDFIKKNTIFKKKHTYNKKTKKRISAIIPVHVWGNAVDLEKLLSICKMRNIAILEDASESFGTKYINGKIKNKYTGTVGKIGCISFNGNKIITTGGGGMILTNDKKIAKRARYLIDQAKDDSFNYIHNDIGYNFRLTNIQAAIGIAQLEKFEEFIKKKIMIHNFYKKNITTSGLTISKTPGYSLNNYWLNILKLDLKILGKKIFKKIIKKLKKNKIDVRPVWHPNHLQKKFKSFQKYKIFNANKIVNSSICLPSSVNLKKTELIKISKVLNG